jgi:CubicO group peptidase (beta-lactamase class C family)
MTTTVKPQDAAAACERIFGKYAGNSPGAVVAVTHRGQVIHRGHYGMADMAQGVALDSRSVIRIGSQTKQFCVLLALMLEAEGKLSMDHEVQCYMSFVPKLERPVTLRHLASNTSGMRDFLEALTYSGAPITGLSTREYAKRVIARQNELNYMPGEAMIYCNTGFFLLSETIEQVSGRTFNELLEARITGPLGMADTRLMKHDSDILPRLAVHHTRNLDGAWSRAQWGVVLGGEGGMVSTLDDMLKWQANVAQPKVGSAAMWQRMTTPAVYANGTTSLYGLGLVLGDYRGLRSIGHGGGVAGGRSESQYYPAAELGIVILGNHDELAPFTLARRIADACLGEALKPPRRPEDLAALEGQLGLWREVGGDDLFELRIKDGEPIFGGGVGAITIDKVAPGTYMPERAVVHYVFSPKSDGTIDATWCGHKRQYRRLPTQLPAASQAIEGRYAHRGLDMQATIAEEGGDGLVLRMTSRFGVWTLALSRVDHDLYIGKAGPLSPLPGAAKDWLYTVKVDAQGVLLDSDRTKHMRLTRVA